MLSSHATKFSSLGTFLLSCYILCINIEINNLQYTNKVPYKDVDISGHIAFMRRHSSKKIVLTNYFLVKENKRTPHRIISQRKHAVKIFSITYIMPKLVRRLVG